MAGCSDASRFADPFSDPFSSGSSASKTYSRNYDHRPTGGINTPSYPSAPRASTHVDSRPLAPVSSTLPRASAAPSQASAAPTPASAGGSHWSIDGGTPVTVGQGETASILATRYGVPTDALLRANGYSNASQVQPGTRLTIPVYRARSAAAEPSAPPAAAHKTAPVATAPKIAAPAPKADPKLDELKRRQAAAEAAEAKAKAAEAKLAQAQAAQGKLVEPKRAEIKADAREPARAEKPGKRVEAVKPETPKLAEAKPARPAAAPAAKTETLALAAPAPKAAPAAPKAAPAAPKAEAQIASVEKPAAEPARVEKSVDKTTTSSIAPAEKPVVNTDGKPEFRWPARGRVIQGFSAGGNDGINIAVPEGTPVKAAEGGTVAYAGSELKGYGNLVLIRHPNGFVTAYAHNGELSVKRGDTVKRGQTIAKSGQSGNVGSPQLHFELRKGSQPVDPTTYMAG
ncbi:MAG: peptidoglycan DD-metalloendopeptidase family protein, partial [Methylocystis sp.]|nr:peptidoglycan DD-metalloendopeptidase family protein [Methylocystis sp.]